MPLSNIVYFCRFLLTSCAVRIFFRSTLVDWRIYFRLLLSTLHASMSYFLGAATTKKKTFWGVANMALHYLAIEDALSAQLILTIHTTVSDSIGIIVVLIAAGVMWVRF